MHQCTFRTGLQKSLCVNAALYEYCVVHVQKFTGLSAVLALVVCQIENWSPLKAVTIHYLVSACISEWPTICKCTALHLLLRTGWNAHTHLWSCNERLHKHMHHCMWCTHKPCALHTFYSTYKKPKSPQLSYPKNDSWAVCEPPPPPPTHTHTLLVEHTNKNC